MQIIEKNIDDLVEYQNNARTHNDDQVVEIANSIKEFGFNNPILIDENSTIIAGHGRLRAAKKLGINRVPTIQLSSLSDEKKRAYIIADNKIALNAGWDFGLLKLEFENLLESDLDLKLTGFSQDEIDLILNPENINEGLCDPDEVPEIDSLSVNKAGDLWQLGNHFLLCGDSTKSNDVAALFGNHKPTLMVTDPPYGVNYDAKWREKELGVGKRSLGKVFNDDKSDWTEAYSLFTGDCAYIWHAGCHSHVVAGNLIDCGFDIISQIIWAKNNFAISRGDYHWKHEPCWYAVRKGKKHNWQGARDQNTLWEIPNIYKDDDSKVGHSTQKPIECMLKPIKNNSKCNDYIYDPFGGSGTTLIASEKIGRNCLIIELHPQYCDIIIKRWQKYTGKEAVLLSNGKTFTEIFNEKEN